MSKHSKLNSARLKISQLKEKYSKNLNNSSSSGEASTSYSSNHSNFKERGPSDIPVENTNEQGNIGYEQNSLLKHRPTSLFNKETKPLSSNDVPEHKQLGLNTTHSRLQSQKSNKLLPKSSTSESELVTDISNALENVHFISVYSNKYSVRPSSESSIKHEHSLILNSRPTPEIPDIKDSNSLKNKDFCKRQHLIENNNNQTFSYDNNTYRNEMLHAEFDSVMSSVEEVITPFESDSEVLENDETQVSNSYQLNNMDNKEHKNIEKEDVKFGNKLNGSLKSKSILTKSSTELAIDKPLQEESNVKDNFVEHSNLEHFTSKKICMPTDVIFDCDKQFHENGRKKVSREEFGEPIIKNRNKSSKTLRVGSDFKSNTLIWSSQHHKFTLKPALKKRPILKSCKLIRYAEANKEEFETLVKKANYVSSILDCKQEYFPFKNRAENCCDGIIKHLLQNQIQLTRHFIDSHHQMYTHCCRTIKVLNNKLVCSQNAGGMGLGE